MPPEERKFCPLMFASPELWDWDGKGFTKPFCLGDKCALWDGTRCAIRAMAANTKPRVGRLEVK